MRIIIENTAEGGLWAAFCSDGGETARGLGASPDEALADLLLGDFGRSLRAAFNSEGRLSHAWTAEDRLRVVGALLPDLQDDIYAGRYSESGRPNITSLQHLLYDPPEALEAIRADLEKAVARWEATRI